MRTLTISAAQAQLRGRKVRFVARAVYVFPGVLDVLFQLADIDIGEIDSIFSQHCKTGRRHIGEPAIDENLADRAIAVHTQRAGLHDRHHRRVVRQHAKLALRARHIDLINLFVD